MTDVLINEWLVAGGDGSDIIVYSIGGDTLEEVSRLSVSPRDRVLGLQFSPDGKTLWIAARASASPYTLYLASAKFSGGTLSGYAEHQTIGTQFSFGVPMAVSGDVLALAVVNVSATDATVYRFDVSSGSPVQTHSVLAGGDTPAITFCGSADQYIAFTTSGGGTLELVNAADLTSVDSYAGRGIGLTARRGTDQIFATGSFGALDALSVSGGSISLIAAGPTAGSGNLVWMPNRGELWSGEYYAPWDGSAWGTRVSTALGPNRLAAAGASELRIAMVSPGVAPVGEVALFRTDTPGTAADSESAALTVARAVAVFSEYQTVEQQFQSLFADASAAPPKVTALISPLDCQRSIDTDVTNLLLDPKVWTVEAIIQQGELQYLVPGSLWQVTDDQPGLRSGRKLLLKGYSARDARPHVPMTLTFWG